jgi:putative ABC transport system substrate-binding protein
MRRRDFIAAFIGAAAAWPPAARAQQPAMPVIGFLQEGDVSTAPRLLVAFRQGLAEAGIVEGKNLAIECRYSKDRPELLPEAAGDLVRLNVNVIFAAAGPTPECN